MSERVKFIVCELGEETESFVLHLFAAMAERERLVIGARNKAALAAAKARGVRLGNPNINNNSQALARFLKLPSGVFGELRVTNTVPKCAAGPTLTYHGRLRCGRFRCPKG
jgi:DNA invertase Pin-like site-specific DNA recombinase